MGPVLPSNSITIPAQHVADRSKGTREETGASILKSVETVKADASAFFRATRRKNGQLDIRKAHALFRCLAGELLAARQFWPALVDSRFGSPIDWRWILGPFERPGRTGKADLDELRSALILWQTVNVRWQRAHPERCSLYILGVLGEKMVWLWLTEGIIREYWGIPKDGRRDWSPEDIVAGRRLRRLVPPSVPFDKPSLEATASEMHREKYVLARTFEELNPSADVEVLRTVHWEWMLDPLTRNEILVRQSEEIGRIANALVRKYASAQQIAESTKISDRFYRDPNRPYALRADRGAKGGRGITDKPARRRSSVNDPALERHLAMKRNLWRPVMKVEEIVEDVNKTPELRRVITPADVLGFARRRDALIRRS